jgi:hypothetical protein
MIRIFFRPAARLVLAASLAAPIAAIAGTDAVADWNARAGEIVAASGLGPPPAFRAMAIVQTAVRDALVELGASRRGDGPANDPATDTAAAAAVAAASRATLVALVPSRSAEIEETWRTAMAAVAPTPARDAGIHVGERAAALVLQARAVDGAGAVSSYRPREAPGAWVPAAAPAVPHWGRRTPWVIGSTAPILPEPPPALDSDAWARDLDEVRTMGARSGAPRSPEQAAAARFWQYSQPPIYFGLVRSAMSSRASDAIRDARLLAAAAQAMDDALIAVFDAKYRHGFWRPVAAIRNADAEGRPRTERMPDWQPMIDAPSHPEYPSAHCVLAGAVGTVIAAAFGPDVTLSTSSPTASGSPRQWPGVDAMLREVADARVHQGVHFRTATEAGLEMGRSVGRVAAARLRISR